MKRKLLAGLLTLCMAAGMAVPAAAATTPAEQEQGAEGPQYTIEEHVLNKGNDWDISDELIMPNEVFRTEGDYDFDPNGWGNYDLDGRLDYQRDVMMANVELLLSKPSSGFEFVWENDSKLITSTPDISKLTPIPEDFNLTKIAYDRGDLDDLLKDEACTEDTREQLNSLMETTREINTGYINETGLPMVLRSVSGGSTNDEGDGFGGPYGLHHVYDAKSTTMAGATVIFLEPYYELSYETNIIGIEFTEEELEQFPKGYYIQREAQQLVLPNTVIPGHHLARWYGLGIDETDIVVEDGKSIITFDWENNLSKNIVNDVSFFTELRAAYTEGRTVTFNPNGGKLKDGDAPIREIDMKDEEDSKFFDIGEVVPVREGYAFVGWCTSSDCTDESLITDTTSDDWLPNYYWMEEKDYDVQVYAKWEKNVTELTNSDTNVSISLTDGVPEDATLSADTIAQESVLESRPELKEELPGLLSIYDISVRQNGETLEIKDNPMTVKIPLNDHLKGYKYYQAVYLGDPLERFDAVVEGDFLVFETDHLSQYAILGSNTPFETSEKPTDPTDPTDPTTPTDPTDPAGPTDPTTPTDPTEPTDPTDPTTPTDPTEPTDPAKPEQQGKPSGQTESPQTGDSSDMALWISLMLASCGGVLGMLFYRRKKAAAGK